MSGKLAPYLDIIRQCAEQGRAPPDIADFLYMEYGIDVTRQGVLYFCRQNNIAYRHRSGLKLSESQQRRFKEQRARGMTYTELQTYWGISRPTVARYVKRLSDECSPCNDADNTACPHP